MLNMWKKQSFLTLLVNLLFTIKKNFSNNLNILTD